MGFMRTVVLCVLSALAVAVLLAGCGSGRSATAAGDSTTGKAAATVRVAAPSEGEPVQRGQAPASAADDGPPVSTVVHVPADALQRRDAPPAGVAQQVEYVGEGGMDACDPPGTAHGLAIGLSAGVIPRDEPVSLQHLRVGDEVGLCLFATERGGTAELRVQTPRGALPPRAFDVTSSYEIAPLVYVVLRPSDGAGDWTFEVRHRGERATYPLEVRPPAGPGFHAVGSFTTDPEIVIVGVPPGAPFDVSVYRPAPPSPGAPAAVAAHVTTISGRADAEGSATVAFTGVAADSCFITQVRVDGQVIETKPFYRTFCGP